MNVVGNDTSISFDQPIKVDDLQICEDHEICCYPSDSGETCLPSKGCFTNKTQINPVILDAIERKN